MSPLCRHVYLLAHFDYRFLLEAVSDEVLDGDDFHSPFLCLYLEVRHTSHCSVVVHDFHEGASGTQSGKTAEVDGGLGVSATAQHAIVLGIQRVDVARTSECLRWRCWGGKRLDCCCTVGSRYTGGASFKLVDGHCERCAEHTCVVAHLVGQVELLTPRQRDRCAKHATCVHKHEIHFLRSNLLGCDYEVALVLTVFIVNNDYKFSFFEVFHGILNAAKF